MATDLKKQLAVSQTPPRRVTKKEQILSLFASGVQDVQALADIAGARPS
jgi:hypothetical protein